MMKLLILPLLAGAFMLSVAPASAQSQYRGDGDRGNFSRYGERHIDRRDYRRRPIFRFVEPRRMFPHAERRHFRGAYGRHDRF